LDHGLHHIIVQIGERESGFAAFTLANLGTFTAISSERFILKFEKECIISLFLISLLFETNPLKEFPMKRKIGTVIIISVCLLLGIFSTADAGVGDVDTNNGILDAFLTTSSSAWQRPGSPTTEGALKEVWFVPNVAQNQIGIRIDFVDVKLGAGTYYINKATKVNVLKLNQKSAAPWAAVLSTILLTGQFVCCSGLHACAKSIERLRECRD